MFGHVHPTLAVQLITCRLVATSPARAVPNRLATARDGAAGTGERPVFFESAGGFVTTAVFDRYRLAPGTAFEGPAVVEERESTAVVPPGATVRVDDELNLMIRLGSSG
jgi:N-methylhydantoinase A